MTSQLDITVAENALKSIGVAQSRLLEAFDYDKATNLFRKELPEWAARLNMDLHAAHENLINAIDPDLDREHGWWERI